MKPLRNVSSVIALAACMCGVVVIASPQRDESTGTFEPIATVLSSPRCANCHFAGDARPMEEGRIHAMVVRRGKDGRGTPAMRCTNCHQDVSVPVAHAPPGAPDWRLPPAATPMAWKGLTAGEQCRMLKDRSRNGNRTLEELIEHLRRDPLVVASWNPGPGRMPPPISHDAFVESVTRWVERGATCPE